MHTEDTSDGPAIRCPGHPAEERCEDYPDGACRRCNEVEDARPSRQWARRTRDVNTGLILGAGPRPQQPRKSNPYPNGPR